MMMIVRRLLSLPERDRGVFPGEGESVDSWSPGPKPLCHRHPTGPHPSGLLWTPWTPAEGEAMESDFALGIDHRHGVHLEQPSGLGEPRDVDEGADRRIGRVDVAVADNAVVGAHLVRHRLDAVVVDLHQVLEAATRGLE